MYDNHNRNHYPFYYTSCITLNSIRYKYPFASTLNALADFNTTHLDLLADISVKYHRTGSYADPIIPLQPSFFNPHIHSRHLCSTHPQLQSYMISHQCSTSWISAIQEAAEAAMLRHNQTVHFSFDFIKECAPIDDDGCNGMHVIERNKRVSKSSFIIGFHLVTKLGIMNKSIFVDWLITK